MREALEAVAKVVLDLTLAIRGASVITLIAAVLVLGGALATGHRHRVYDAVVLKMLGATRGRLLAAYALEYLLIGLATALVGVAAGSLAACLVMTEVMNLAFVWLPRPGAGCDTWRAACNHRVRADRHVLGARPETRAGPAASVVLATNRRVDLRQVRRLAARHMLALRRDRHTSSRPRAFCPFERAVQDAATEHSGDNMGVSTMSDFDRNAATAQFGRRSTRSRSGCVDEGLRAYMLRIYNYMVLGLAITGVAALGIYMLSVTTDPAHRGA